MDDPALLLERPPSVVRREISELVARPMVYQCLDDSLANLGQREPCEGGGSHPGDHGVVDVEVLDEGL